MGGRENVIIVRVSLEGEDCEKERDRDGGRQTGREGGGNWMGV